MEPKFNCDETRPYIFISYAHLDWERVCPILERLYESGFNIWYDKIITAGTSWDDNIALHIDTSAYFIAFISENYLNSDNCKDELSYARDLNKEMLLIYLDEVNLPAGLAMRLNRSQAVIWNKEDDTYSDEDFTKIINAKGIRKAQLNADDTDDSSGEKEIGTSSPTTVSEAIPPVSQVQQPRDTSNKKLVDLSKAKALQIALFALVAVLAIGLTITLVYIITQDKGSTDNREAASSTESDFDLDAYESQEEANSLKYKDALDAEVVTFEYWVENDVEKQETTIHYWVELHNPNQAFFIDTAAVKFSIRGKDGSILDTRDEYYYSILAGDTVAYEGEFSSVYESADAVPNVTYDVINTEWADLDDPELRPLSEIKFSNLTERVDESVGDLRITGEITLGPNSKSDLHVLVVFYKDGKCVYTDKDYLDSLIPGKKQAFSFSLITDSSDIPEFDHFDLKVLG